MTPDKVTTTAAGHCYRVVGPECSAVDPILEYWRDFVYVYACNGKRARVLALRWFRRRYPHGTRDRWQRDYLSDPSSSPFVGMTIARVVREQIDERDHWWATPAEIRLAQESDADFDRQVDAQSARTQ